jgi:hypothetical protein
MRMLKYPSEPIQVNTSGVSANLTIAFIEIGDNTALCITDADTMTKTYWMLVGTEADFLGMTPEQILKKMSENDRIRTGANQPQIYAQFVDAMTRLLDEISTKLMHIRMEFVTTLGNFRQWLRLADRFRDFAILDLVEDEVSEEDK